MYEDIYFLNSQEALRVASEQNRWADNDGKVKYNLQCCYYDGEKLDSDLPNLFHMPIDSLFEGIANGINKIPSKIDFTGLDISYKVKTEITTFFNMTMQEAKSLRKQLNIKYVEELKKAKLDFDEPLRFYLIGNSKTVVMQYITKAITDTLANMGYEVLYNLYVGTEDEFCLKILYEFNPHVTININHLNNTYISDDVFNFVWFQDMMPDIYFANKVYKRDRDYIFMLTQGLKEILDENNIQSELMSFMINENIYYKRNDIKKEKKIVLIGSSYAKNIEKIRLERDFTRIYKEAVEIFEKTSCLRDVKYGDSEIKYLMHKYSKSKEYINNIYGYLIRDYCVEKLCSIKTDYEIEIYGYGWEDNSIVKPYFKGILNHGEDISKVYNSATYGYCPGGYILMQRTLECAFSQTIPLVLDVRADKQDEYDKRVEESLEIFHIKDLESILEKEVKDKNFDYIKERYGYEYFIKKCLNIIKKELI